ncbi:hypothetical protein [Nocardiopsis dassonvillei]|uniref:hypothetical protein n=1 Tax=Nocardiopsis dassonvillei TaxID=2014 RepID=UPI00366F54A2
MPKSRPAYQAECRHQIIALARSDRSPENLVTEFESSAQTIPTWIKQAGVSSGRSKGTTSDDKAKLVRLHRENAHLHKERKILCKATNFFVRGQSVMFRLIDEEKTRHSVSLLARLLGVSR